MYRNNICISIFWDQELNIYGIKYLKYRKRRIIKELCFSQDLTKPFAERLESVYKKLVNKDNDLIVIGGYLKSAVWFELKIPSLSIREIKNYLKFELPRYIPYSLDKVNWWFRPIYPNGSIKAKKIDKVKIFVLPIGIWEELISSLSKAKVKADAFIYPYMALNPNFRDLDIYLDTIETDFYCCAADNPESPYMRLLKERDDREIENLLDTLIYFEAIYKKVKMTAEETIGYYIPNILLSEYALSKTFVSDMKENWSLPKLMIPRRFKFLKLLSMFLFLIIMLLSVVFLIRKSLDNLSVINELSNQKSVLIGSKTTLEHEMLKGEKFTSVIETLFSVTPKSTDLLLSLKELTNQIPEDTWVTNFNSYGDKINISLQSKGINTDQMISSFYRSSVFNLDNSRKRKSDDGFEYIYMTLSEKEDDKSK